MLDIFANDAVVIGVMIAAGLYLALRVFVSFRWTVRRGKGRKLDDTEATAQRADMHALAVNLEAASATARTLQDQTQAAPDAPFEAGSLDFEIPIRFQGDLRKLEKLAAPYGPLAALAARKAQNLRFRLLDKNWEPAQRREGLDTSAIYGRMAKDFTLAASQARRAERLLKDNTDSPTRRARLRQGKT